VQSQTGHSYSLFAKDSLDPNSGWNNLATFSGDGSVLTFTDFSVTGVPYRFYRVLRQ